MDYFDFFKIEENLGWVNECTYEYRFITKKKKLANDFTKCFLPTWLWPTQIFFFWITKYIQLRYEPWNEEFKHDCFIQHREPLDRKLSWSEVTLLKENCFCQQNIILFSLGGSVERRRQAYLYWTISTWYPLQALFCLESGDFIW